MADGKRARRMHLDFDTIETDYNQNTGQMTVKIVEYDYEKGNREVVMKITRWQLEYMYESVQRMAARMLDETIKTARRCGVEADNVN